MQNEKGMRVEEEEVEEEEVKLVVRRLEQESGRRDSDGEDEDGFLPLHPNNHGLVKIPTHITLTGFSLVCIAVHHLETLGDVESYYKFDPRTGGRRCPLKFLFAAHNIYA